MKIKSELIIPGKLKDEPTICDVCKKFDISVTITEASYGKDTGKALVSFNGSKSEIVKVMAYLKKLGIEIKKNLNFS